jgi:acetyltransferase
MDRAPISFMLYEGATLRLHDGRSVRVRPVGPADAESIQAFVRGLSDTSRRLRFFAAIRELAPSMLARLTASAGRAELVLLAEARDGEAWSMVALAQYAPGEDDGTCDLALVVADAWQGLGLGRAPLEVLVQSARDARCRRAIMDVLRDNEAILALAGACHFAVARSPHGSTVLRLVRDLWGALPIDPAWFPAASAPQTIRIQQRRSS